MAITTTDSTIPPFVITIGRETGSGGRKIGQILAQRLGIAYYDKEILAQAAVDTGVERKVMEKAKIHTRLLHQVIGAVQPFLGGGDIYTNQFLSDEDIYTLESKVIEKVAAERSCVIVGRVADHILRNHPRCIRLFITAQMEHRTRRIMDERKVDFKNALHYIAQTDEQRAGYYTFHASNPWGNASQYDLCINSSLFGIDETAEFLLQFISQRLELFQNS